MTVEPSGLEAARPDLVNVGTFALRRAIHHRHEWERERERRPRPPVPAAAAGRATRHPGETPPEPGRMPAPGPAISGTIGPSPSLRAGGG